MSPPAFRYSEVSPKTKLTTPCSGRAAHDPHHRPPAKDREGPHEPRTRRRARAEGRHHQREVRRPASGAVRFRETPPRQDRGGELSDVSEGAAATEATMTTAETIRRMADH